MIELIIKLEIASVICHKNLGQLKSERHDKRIGEVKARNAKLYLLHATVHDKVRL